MTPNPPNNPASDYWLGTMPGHWQRTTMRAITRPVSEKRRPDLPLLSVYRDLGVIQRSADDENHNVIPEDLTNYKVVRPGQLVLNKMKSWQGSLGVSAFEGIVSPAYIVCALRGGHNPRFVNYLLRCNPYVFAWKRISYGVRCDQWDLRYADFKQTPVFLPPHAEQDAIVAFLESKERDIHTFIANKRRTVELLKEQETALLNRAIIRGLNAKAPFRSSGIPWIGDIPEHWQLGALRRFWDVLDCKHVTVPFLEEGYRLASVIEVRNFNLDLSEAMRTSEQHFKLLIAGGRQPHRGDVIYCRNTANTGTSSYVDTDEPIAMGQDVCLIKSRGQNGRFLNYVLHSAFMAAQLQTILVGSTFKRINVAEIKALLVVVPPRDEQDAIVCHLDDAGRGIAQAVANAEREIALMEQYRTALISAAVTGKLDVRQASGEVAVERRPNRHFARALLSAEIVHQLHPERTFGRIKHQKILHLCEYIGGIEEIQGEYHREAAGPLDNRLIYSVEAELKKQKWFAEYAREKFGHGYRPLEKAGGHRAYVEKYWQDKLPVIQRLIELMRSWDTERCEIFSTAYAAWNDLLIWQKPVTDDAITHEILHRWHDRKKQVPESRWRKALEWMRKEGFVPTGFGKATAKCDTVGSKAT